MHEPSPVHLRNPRFDHPTKRLEAIADPKFRNLIRNLVDSGIFAEMITVADRFEVSLNQGQMAAEIRVLKQEYALWDLDVSAEMVAYMVYMRESMLPLHDDAVALVASRLWLAIAVLDDMFGSDLGLCREVLRDLNGVGVPSSSAYARYLRFAFGEVGRCVGEDVEAACRTLCCSSITGVLTECEYSRDVSDRMSTDWVRNRCGFSEFWGYTLAFAGPSLKSWRLWASVMEPMVAYLNDVNDLLSIYKEAVDGRDFSLNRLYRISVRQGGSGGGIPANADWRMGAEELDASGGGRGAVAGPREIPGRLLALDGALTEVPPG
ncbi:hypothetical protein ACPCKL_33020 [Streptomyces cellulosae]